MTLAVSSLPPAFSTFLVPATFSAPVLAILILAATSLILLSASYHAALSAPCASFRVRRVLPSIFK